MKRDTRHRRWSVVQVILAKQQGKSHVVPGIDAPVFPDDRPRSTFPKARSGSGHVEATSTPQMPASSLQAAGCSESQRCGDGGLHRAVPAKQ